MKAPSTAALTLIVIISAVLGIVEIVLSQLGPNDCSNRDIGLNLTPRDFLLGLGIVDLIRAFAFGVAVVSEEVAAVINVGCMMLLSWIFSLIWFIIGAVILFRSNIACIHDSSIPTISALVLWCIMAWGICCSGSKNDKD